MEIGVNIAEPSAVAKPFQCTICPKSFLFESSLEEHTLIKHVEDKEFQCTACLETRQLVKSFATQHILNKHIKRVHGPPRFKCHVCFKTFKDSSNFAAHKRIHSQAQANLKGHKCALCSKSFRFKFILQAHLFNIHKQKREGVSYFKCEICSREFLKTSELELHVIHQHVVDKPFECPVCSKTFMDQQSLEKHMKRHDNREKKYSCDVCSKEFISKKSLVHHLGVNHKHFFYCDKKCLRSFKNKPDFDAHSADSLQELKCSICEEIINSECNLKIHTDSHVKEIKTNQNQVKIETQTKPKKTRNKLLKVEATKIECQLCSKTFDREAYFSAHRNQVHPNAEWKCDYDQCSKSYRWYNQLRRHKMMHAETKAFVCNICQKSFYRPDSLRGHQQVHLKERKYKCKICPKSFITPFALRTHIANNHGGIKPFKCPVIECGTFWANNYQLNVHLISHQTDKSFKCELCTKLTAFKTLGQLKDHRRRVHPEMKNNRARSLSMSNQFSEALVFICSSNACSFETVSERAVALHLNEQHALPKVALLKNIDSPAAMSKEPQEMRSIIRKLFKCDICFELFESAPTLFKHQALHSNAIPVKCPVCSKSIRFKRNLPRHVQNFHNKKST